jgi:hypothetical protein
VSVHVEFALKVVYLVGALGVVWWYSRRGLAGGIANRSKWLVVVLGFCSWLNWGKFHTDGTFLHDWDQFHYVLGAKYFPEVHYDGLYAAVLLGLEESAQDFKPPKRVRDLRIDRIVDFSEIAAHQREVRARFSSERWAEFKHDAKRLRVRSTTFLDRGYNAPPALIAISRALVTWPPLGRPAMWLFGVLDLALLVGAFVLIGYTFGVTEAALCATLLGGAFLSRFFWIGGAFMRQDWFFATVAALCALHTRRYALAGAALAYAISVRVFPVLLLLPLAVWFAKCWRDVRASALRFGAGLALVGALLFGAGLFVGPGAESYAMAYQKLAAHNRKPVGNAIGMRALALASADNLSGKLTDPDSLYEFNAVDDRVEELGKRRGPLLLAISIVGVGLMCLLGFRASSAAEAAVLGIVGILWLGNIGCYYWMLLSLLPMVGRRRGFVTGALANLMMFAWSAIALLAPHLGLVTRFSVSSVFVPCSLLLAVALLAWCAPWLRTRPHSQHLLGKDTSRPGDPPLLPR